MSNFFNISLLRSFCGKRGIGYFANLQFASLNAFLLSRRGAPCKNFTPQKLKINSPFYIQLSSNKFVSVGYKKRDVEFLQHLFASFVLRKERDSNPRYSCPYTAFRVRPDRPLRHLSFQKRCKDRYFFVKLYRFGAKKCKKEHILHLHTEYQ